MTFVRIVYFTGNRMKHVSGLIPTIPTLILIALGFYASSVIAESQPPASKAKQGEFLGAKNTEYPDWFKDSFVHQNNL